MLKRSSACMVALLLASAVGGVRASADEGRVLLVIPPRHTVVQVAFGIARLRPAYVVAYDTRGRQSGFVLHLWNEEKRDWVATTLEEFQSGSLFDPAPDAVVLIGADQDIPAEVAAAATQNGKTQRITSLLIKDIINGINARLSFTPSEWHWLTRQYRLETKDLNAERRRYGRYGKPGSAPAPVPAAEPAPVPVTEETPALEAPAKPALEPVEPLLEDL
jgi:hypothetical protein